VGGALRRLSRLRRGFGEQVGVAPKPAKFPSFFGVWGGVIFSIKDWKFCWLWVLCLSRSELRSAAGLYAKNEPPCPVGLP